MLIFYFGFSLVFGRFFKVMDKFIIISDMFWVKNKFLDKKKINLIFQQSHLHESR